MQFAGVPVMDVDDLPSDYGRWLIHGPQGSGKTTLASTIAEMGKTLYIDLVGEKGVRSFKGAPYAKNIDVIRPTSITALDDIYWALAKGGHGYNAVVVDSLTSVQKMALRFLTGHDETAVREIKQGTAPATRQTWGQSLDIMTDMATFWHGLADGNRKEPMHVVMTAQTKFKEDEEGNLRRAPDVQAGALSTTISTPDYVLYTDFEENMEALGDDTVPDTHHIVRFGFNPEYRIKARLPFRLQGKMPSVLGRTRPTSLTQLSTVLGIGGAPAPAKKNATKKEQAA